MQLDIVKIMKNIQKLKIIMKNSLMSPDIEYQMLHSEKFLLDIDNESSESSDSQISDSSSDVDAK